jgi:hypothetical protein
MTLKSALEALETDAKTWDGVNESLTSAAASATFENLTDDEFSWAGSASGLTATYASLQQKIAGLCSGGATEAGNIAVELRNVKKTYEGTDEAAKARLQGVWDVA